MRRQRRILGTFSHEGIPRERQNRRESVVIGEMLFDGWEVYVRGWPDLLCYKDGKVLAIEVKGPKSQGGATQRRVHALLRQAGLEVVIRNVP
jgi:hypothetical protein